MAPFAGYEMPISYPLGVMKEHLHCRAAAGLFDVSHMGQLVVIGAGTDAFISRLLSLDPATIADGESRYSFLLADDAGFIDDLIATRISADSFGLVVNGACKDKDLVHIYAVLADFDATLTVLDRALIALQGPQAVDVMTDRGLSVTDMAFMSQRTLSDGTGGDLIISRSGYTGEDGFEISLPVSSAEAFCQELLNDDRVEAIGLGARDSLRLEGGLPLYGQDLTDQLNPAEAGLIWAIPKTRRDATDFIGGQALQAIRAQGAAKKRVGLLPEGRAPVRAGTKLFDHDGNEIGEVTSGGFGPTVGSPVAMGYVQTAFAKADTDILAEVRGKRLPVKTARMPFITPGYKR